MKFLDLFATLAMLFVPTILAMITITMIVNAVNVDTAKADHRFTFYYEDAISLRHSLRDAVLESQNGETGNVKYSAVFAWVRIGTEWKAWIGGTECASKWDGAIDTLSVDTIDDHSDFIVTADDPVWLGKDVTVFVTLEPC